MYRIENITSSAKQRHALVLPDNTTCNLLLVYRPDQLGWFIEELIYDTFTLRCVRVSNYPNILHQWRNLIPFGLGCFTKGNREPTQAEDFESEQSSLYILDELEVEEYQEYLNNG